MSIQQRIESIFAEEASVPRQFAEVVPQRQTEYLLNGELRQWDGSVQQVFSPVWFRSSSGLSPAMVGSHPLLTEKESLAAADAAVRAYNNGMGAWPSMPVAERIRAMEEFAYRMKEKRKKVATLISWEIGKSLEDAEKEFDRTVQYIWDTIDALKDLDRVSSRFLIEQGIIGQIRRAPLGVTLCMGPYNYPLNETFATLIPALIMGNAVILKPPRVGVLLYRPLLEAFRDAFPAGVINTVYGRGERIIGPLMTSGKIDVLAFIGSSGVADGLKKQHPKPHRLRCILGLGAKNAAIILPDADLDLAVKECILGTLSFNGQRCTALKILFVHSRIIDAFLGRLVEAVSALKFGMPWEGGVFLTPLPEVEKVKQMSELVEDAEQYGARVVNDAGGDTNRTFFYPAVLYPVNARMRLYSEEQFGPVIPVLSFDAIETPIRYIVESNYGHQASVFGSDPDEVGKLIDALVNQVCRVNINSQCQRSPDKFPFVGRKDSGEGTLSVSDALRVFSVRTLLAAKESEVNRTLITKIVRERKSSFLSTDYIL